MTRRRLWGIAALLLTAAGPGDPSRDPGGYAVRLSVTPAPGGGVQRLTLPAAAIVAIRNPDGTDVRVFDARGRPVPIARLAPAAALKRDSLIALPILGARDTRMGARVSVRLDDHGQARVAEVESGGPASRDVAALGALLDSRGVHGAAERLDFIADIPVGQPVRFTVEASPDLDHWRPLGERILYRAPDVAPFEAQIPLRGAPLNGEYLRVTWRATTPLMAPVGLRAVMLISSGEKAQIVVAARAPALEDDHAFAFLAPASALASLRIVPTDGDGAVAIRIFGRDNSEQPWTPLASGIAASDRPALPLRASSRTFRIEADRRGAGFSAPPMIELGFMPRAVAFAASGPAPFVLAAGREGASDMFTPLDTLSPTSDPAQARVEDGPPIKTLTLSAPDERQGSHRRALLWLVLLGAVALLVGLVWWTARRPAPAE